MAHIKNWIVQIILSWSRSYSHDSIEVVLFRFISFLLTKTFSGCCLVHGSCLYFVLCVPNLLRPFLFPCKNYCVTHYVIPFFFIHQNNYHRFSPNILSYFFPTCSFFHIWKNKGKKKRLGWRNSLLCSLWLFIHPIQCSLFIYYRIK